jgi:hypothetical protein
MTELIKKREGENTILVRIWDCVIVPEWVLLSHQSFILTRE